MKGRGKLGLKKLAKGLRGELTQIKRNMRKSTGWGGRRRR